MTDRERQKAASIISEIADREGVLEEEVRGEMQRAIDAGMKSTDPQARAFWASTPWKNRRPGLEEFLVFMSRTVMERTESRQTTRP